MDFWEEQDYIKSKHRFDTDEIWGKLIKDYNSFTDQQLYTFYQEFEQLKNYGDKLRFWKENRLSPMKLQYLFKLQIENHAKEERITLSLEPIGNNEKKEYLSWAIEQCYENFKLNKLNYGFDTVPLENLKKRFRRLKGVLSTNIKDETSKTKLRIKKIGLDSDVYPYLTYRKSEPNILSDLNIDTYSVVVSLQYFAIKVAFVYDFLEYLLFLEDCKIENRIPKSDTKHISFTDKSFKAKEDIDLEDLYGFLATNKYIEDTGYDKFKNVFTEVIIKEEIKKENKINWISRTSKGANWQALYVLIYFCCGEEIFKNNADADIEKKLDNCFTAPNNRFNRVDGFSRAKRDLGNEFAIKLSNVKELYNYFH